MSNVIDHEVVSIGFENILEHPRIQWRTVKTLVWNRAS